jgi:cell division transport system permease protein
MLTSIKRIFKSGFSMFSRDREVALATIFILCLAVGLISSLFLFSKITQFIVSSAQEKIDISVYFSQETDEEDILGIKEEIVQFPEVKEVVYVSPEEALADFIERHKNEPDLIESIEEVGRNPFLASLSIQAWNPSQYGAVSNFLETADFEDVIEKIDYFERKSVIERISSLSSDVTKLGVFISLVLISIAVLVTFNTIRLSIYNSSEEIKIQRLVGASNWAIRGPFLSQGLISGLLATLICFLLFGLLSLSLNSTVESLFYGLSLSHLFSGNLWTIVLLQAVAGLGLGMFSSSIAIRKYLKV